MENRIRPENRKKPNFEVFEKVFDPVIPGIITAGLCSGFAALIAQFVPGYAENPASAAVYYLLSLVSTAFMSFMPAWVGYSACDQFGGTAILGGMLGMITGLSEVNDLAQTLGLYNAADPAASILCSGRGGVLAAILVGVLVGAFFALFVVKFKSDEFIIGTALNIFAGGLTGLENWLHKRMPKSVDMVLTPFCTFLLVLVPYLLLVMPLTGLISTVLCGGVRLVCMSEHPAVRILAGYGCTAVFLVAVMMGMQYAFVALYSMELDSYGYVTLFPTLAMAGAGQVGAGLALLVKARKTGNARFANVIGATIVPGMMGVGTPLLYGVTLPLGRPFVTACLGGGFGGAFIMACGVASSGWGASGLLGIPMMGAGPVGTKGMLLYCVGLAISCIMGFVLTFFTVPAERVKDV